MALSDKQVRRAARELLDVRAQEEGRLNRIHNYVRDDPAERRLPGLPPGIPHELVRLARVSRVNLLKYIVAARCQSLFVDGFQTPASADNLPAWEVWQRNGFDARQIGVHRAALAYGAAYVTVLPGEPVPVMRGKSPRKMTVGYGDDDMWPEMALEWLGKGRWRLYDSTSVYTLTGERADGVKLVKTDGHGMTYQQRPVCPVIRYRDTDDLDDPVQGIVEPHMPLQDQINLTTFGLQVAQHYGAFRQLLIIGWAHENPDLVLKRGAAQVLAFEDEDIQVTSLPQTDLRGHLESREASIRHLATVSQTAVHELMGQFVNLSADALEAARASHYAAVEENRTQLGESHEQALNLVGEAIGQPVEPSAAARWRDTRIRSLTEAATGLGTLVEKLGVPPRALWPRVPGVAEHELAQWRAGAADGDQLAEQLAAALAARQ